MLSMPSPVCAGARQDRERLKLPSNSIVLEDGNFVCICPVASSKAHLTLGIERSFSCGTSSMINTPIAEWGEEVAQG